MTDKFLVQYVAILLLNEMLFRLQCYCITVRNFMTFQQVQ